MTSLSYNSYIRDVVNSSFESYYTFTNVSNSLSNRSYSFKYGIIPELDKIRLQAEFFSNKIISEGITKNTFFNNAPRTSQAFDLVRDSYIYSYYKAVYYGTCRQFAISKGIFSHTSSYMFRGHYELYKNLSRMDIITEYTPLLPMVSLSLISEEELIAEIQDMFPKSVDIAGRFFDPQLESVLRFFQSIDMVVVDDISSFNGNVDPSHSPLGNVCFTEDMQSIKYLDTVKVKSDIESFFWGKACCITLIEEQQLDIDDSIYNSVPFIRYDFDAVSYEVLAITGYSGYKFMTRSTGPSSGSGYNPVTPRSDFPKPVSGDNGGSSKSSSNRRNSNRRGGGNTSNSVTFVNRLGNLFRDKIITKQNINDVINIITISNNMQLSRSDKKQLIGLKLENALKRYNIDFDYDDRGVVIQDNRPKVMLVKELTEN